MIPKGIPTSPRQNNIQKAPSSKMSFSNSNRNSHYSATKDNADNSLYTANNNNNSNGLNSSKKTLENQ
jgi:hypothetical protein